MSQENILDYLRKTPHNTNVNVVKGMISGVGGSLPEVTESDNGKVLTVVDGQWSKAESDGDKGYECTETMTLLTEENVTTVQDGDFVYGDLSYSQLINTDMIRVTFNDTVYECERMLINGNNVYGALQDSVTEIYDWSEYPFSITSVEGLNELNTETAGTYSIKIEAVELSVETTPCFRKAVESISGATQPLIVHDVAGVLDKTATEIDDAFYVSRQVYIRDDSINSKLVSVFLNDRNFIRTFAIIDAQTRTIVTYTEGSDGYPVKDTQE